MQPLFDLVGRKVLFGAAPIFGHSIPALRLAIELRSAGSVISGLSDDSLTNQLYRTHEAETIQLPKSGDFKDQISVVRANLEAYQPDITICDWHKLLWCALRSYRPLCRVSILRCETLKGYERMNPLLPDKFQFKDESVLTWINDAFKTSGLPVVNDLRDLCSSEIVVVPSVPQIDPLPDGVHESYPNTSFVYTGPLLIPLGLPLSDPIKEWLLLRRQEGMPILLITLGTVWGASLYQTLADCLERIGIAVVMIIPQEKERRLLEVRNGPRFQAIGICNLLELAGYADIVLHHCGHATMHAILLAGKPSIILSSGEQDREDNAVRLEDLSCARYLGQNYFRRGLDGDAFLRLIMAVLRDSNIQRGINDMSQTVKEYVEQHGTREFVHAVAQRLLHS